MVRPLTYSTFVGHTDNMHVRNSSMCAVPVGTFFNEHHVSRERITFQSKLASGATVLLHM